MVSWQACLGGVEFLGQVLEGAGDAGAVGRVCGVSPARRDGGSDVPVCVFVEVHGERATTWIVSAW